MLIDSEVFLEQARRNPVGFAARVEVSYSALTDWLLHGSMPEEFKEFRYALKAVSHGRRYRSFERS